MTGVTDSNLRSIVYQYDQLGNRTATITPAPEGKIIKYFYNQNHQITKIEIDKDNYTLTYDSLNRRRKRILPNLLLSFNP